ncbi:hypothetical protein AMTRI_Chr01g131640 [Amborella trichopoda]
MFPIILISWNVGGMRGVRRRRELHKMVQPCRPKVFKGEFLNSLSNSISRVGTPWCGARDFNMVRGPHDLNLLKNKIKLWGRTKFGNLAENIGRLEHEISTLNSLEQTNEGSHRTRC